MKKASMGLVLVLCLNVAAQQIEFTAAEGYKSKALNGQNGWTASDWKVNPEDHSVSVSAKWKKAMYTQEPIVLQPGGTVTVRIAFRLQGSPVTPVSANTPVMGVGLSADRSIGFGAEDSNQTVLMLSMNGMMQLRNANNTKGLIPSAVLPIEGNATAKLAIEYKLTLGSTAADSIFSAKLINLSSAQETPMGSYKGLNEKVFSAAATTGLYPWFNTQLFDAGASGVTGITVDSMQVSPDLEIKPVFSVG